MIEFAAPNAIAAIVVAAALAIISLVVLLIKCGECSKGEWIYYYY